MTNRDQCAPVPALEHDFKLVQANNKLPGWAIQAEVNGSRAVQAKRGDQDGPVEPPPQRRVAIAAAEEPEEELKMVRGARAGLAGAN